jgi:hypothetical protein
MKKPIVYFIGILSVAALAACDLGGSDAGEVVETEVANTTMARALGNMTAMTEGSLDMTLATDSTVAVTRDVEDNTYGWADEVVNVSIDAEVNAKVDDLWGTAPKASLSIDVTEAIINAVGTYDSVDETYIDIDVSDEQAYAYYDGEYAYMDLSAAPSLIEALFDVNMAEQTSEEFPTKLKGYVGTIAELGIPDLTDPENLPASSEVDAMVEEMVPMLEMMPNTTATMVGTELRIVYSLTQEDLPELVEEFMIEFARQMGQEIPSSIDASLQAEIDAMVAEILSVIDLDEFRIEVRIDSTRNVFTLFEIALDATLTINETIYDGYYDEGTYEWVEFEIESSQVIDIDTTTTLTINAFSEPVAITFPTDLDDYLDMTEE